MNLAMLFEIKRKEITEAWLAKTLSTYPKDSHAFLFGQKDRFANPVGHTHSIAIDGLAKALLDGEDSEHFKKHLEEVIKIRSIQDFSAKQSISFVFFVKDIVREIAENEIKDRTSGVFADLSLFDSRIDEMALMAFDIYVELRERLYKIRVDEVKRTVSSIIRRTGFFEEDKS